MNGMARLARGGAWALMPLFVAAAAGWRFFHATAPPRVAETNIVPVARRPLPQVEEAPVAPATPALPAEPASEPSGEIGRAHV
jgi:hypothetical protein